MRQLSLSLSLSLTPLPASPVACSSSSSCSSQITFEAHTPLEADLDWSVTYVGSAVKDFDQRLDTVSVGPISVGMSRFLLETPGPDPKKIPADDVLGATICIISCSYREKEFVRVSYWVSTTYSEPLAEGEEPPKPCPPEKVVRTVLADKPRVTKWTIPW